MLMWRLVEVENVIVQVGDEIENLDVQAVYEAMNVDVEVS